MSNTRIVLESTNDFDSGYGSGSSYYSKESILDLLRGLRYRLVETSFSRVSYGGMSVGGPSRKQSSGRWEVRVTGPPSISC